MGAGLVAVGLLLIAEPAWADQTIMASDSSQVDCQASAKDLTRISLVEDEFASVSKISTGNPTDDFSVVNEPVRGDIYLSVPEGFGRPALSFFGTTKRGYVYKFVCRIGGEQAAQVFVSNPAIAKDRSGEAVATTVKAGPQDAAVELVQAMYSNSIVDGYEMRQRTAPGLCRRPQGPDDRGISGAGAHRQGSAHREHGNAPIALNEARSRRAAHSPSPSPSRRSRPARSPRPISSRRSGGSHMALADIFSRTRRTLDGPDEETENVSPVTGEIGSNEVTRKKQRLLLAGVAGAGLVLSSFWIFRGDDKDAAEDDDGEKVEVSTKDLVNRNLSQQEWMALSENQFQSMENQLKSVNGSRTASTRWQPRSRL
jgi:hypothetical protein